MLLGVLRDALGCSWGALRVLLGARRCSWDAFGISGCTWVLSFLGFLGCSWHSWGAHGVFLGVPGVLTLLKLLSTVVVLKYSRVFSRGTL